MKLLLSITTTLLLLLVTTLACAQEVAPDAAVIVATLLSAIKLRAWGVVVGSVLLLFVVAARYVRAVADLWCKIPAKWRPFVVVALGTIATVGNALTHREQWLPILITDAMVNLLPVLLAIVSPVAHLEPAPSVTTQIIPPAPRAPTIAEKG